LNYTYSSVRHYVSGLTVTAEGPAGFPLLKSQHFWSVRPNLITTQR